MINIKNKQISVEALYTFTIVGSTWNIASEISNKMGPRIHPLTTLNNVYKSRTTCINLHKMFSTM